MRTTSIIVCRDGFVNTLDEVCVVAVPGFRQPVTTTLLRRLRSASSAQNARVVWREVNTDGRDLVSPNGGDILTRVLPYGLHKSLNGTLLFAIRSPLAGLPAVYGNS